MSRHDAEVRVERLFDGRTSTVSYNDFGSLVSDISPTKDVELNPHLAVMIFTTPCQWDQNKVFCFYVYDTLNFWQE